MTNATDELLSLLDERGIKYEINRDIKNRNVTKWSTHHGAFVFFAVEQEGKLLVETTVATEHSAVCTPEQAIAATLERDSADVDGALELLDEIRQADRISYDDYSQLFDAIATLGGGKLTAEQVHKAIFTAEQVRKAIFAGSVWDEDNAMCLVSRTDMQAIADELNAAIGGGECHMSFVDEYETASGEEEYLCECSECGYRRWELAHDLPLFCSKCGKAVKR